MVSGLDDVVMQVDLTMLTLASTGLTHVSNRQAEGTVFGGLPPGLSSLPDCHGALLAPMIFCILVEV